MRRAVPGRRLSGGGLHRPGGFDGAGVFAGPVFPRRKNVPQRGHGPPAGRRQSGFSGAPGRAGEDQWPAGRAGRDPGSDRKDRAHIRGGGAALEKGGRLSRTAGVFYLHRGKSARRRTDPSAAAGAAALLYGSVLLPAPAADALYGQRQAGSARSAAVGTAAGSAGRRQERIQTRPQSGRKPGTAAFPAGAAVCPGAGGPGFGPAFAVRRPGGCCRDKAGPASGRRGRAAANLAAGAGQRRSAAGPFFL